MLPNSSTKTATVFDTVEVRTLHVSEFVADAPDCEEKTGMRRIRFDAASQSFDQRVDAADGHERVAAPDAREQRFSAEDDPCVGREQVQQPEFLIRQLDVLARDAYAAPRRIDLDVVDANRRIGG